MIRKMLAAFAACSLLVAVVFFPVAPAAACNSVGGVPAAGGVPAFALQQGGYGGYGAQGFAQQFVQPQYSQQQLVLPETGCQCSQQFQQPIYAQQFQQPVYAQQFVQPNVLGLGLGYAGYGLGFAERVFNPWFWHHHHVPVPVPVPAPAAFNQRFVRGF